jgi:cyanuric acid amidohydrolase
MPYRTDTFRIAMSGPADVSKMTALIEEGALDPATIVAILVKTEGNGGVNDFTREYTCATLATTLAPHLGTTPAEVERRIAMVVSGGTEGVLSPHATIFARTPTSTGSPNGEKRLAIGIAATRDFEPHEIGRAAQIEATAAAVKGAECPPFAFGGDLRLQRLRSSRSSTQRRNVTLFSLCPNPGNRFAS